jgi:hypothetical protein
MFYDDGFMQQQTQRHRENRWSRDMDNVGLLDELE